MEMNWHALTERMLKLFSVKSIVTLVLTGVFAVLSLKGAISGSDFLTIFTVIIAFYYGTQTKKSE